MWSFLNARPTYQIDGGTMNIFSRNLLSAGDDVVSTSDPAMASFASARGTLSAGATQGLHVGFAACFPSRTAGRFTEHWVLFPNFRSPRVAYEGALKRPVNPLTLESAEPEDVLPGGWRNEGEFLAKVREFVAAHPGCRYIRHQREDSLDGVP
ncbi:hypothetical protein L6R49_28245 [Myxococcota bacterium]|nr:hypothetical protein [Myxococcota bacterium]